MTGIEHRRSTEAFDNADLKNTPNVYLAPDLFVKKEMLNTYRPELIIHLDSTLESGGWYAKE